MPGLSGIESSPATAPQRDGEHYSIALLVLAAASDAETESKEENNGLEIGSSRRDGN
jgi:hypothetical protein